MASMGSFPTGVDSSLLIRGGGGGYSRSVVPLIGFRSRQNVGVGVFPDSNLAGVSTRNFTEDHLSFTRLSPCCGCRMAKRVRAKQERTGEDGETDHESDDDASLRATIQKSKKVLAVQRDLLEQIAERKKLISTIKNSVIDPEGSEQPVVEHNQVISSSLDAAATEDATELGKEPPYNANSSGSGWPKEVPSVPWKSSATPHREPSSKDDTSKELRKTAGTTVSRSKTSVEVPLNKQLNAPTIKTAIRSDVPSSTKNEKRLDLKDSMPEDQNVKVLDSFNKNASTPPLVPAKEDLESPPLAGANVMNIIMVSAECAPWSKTGGLGDVAGALPKALARRGHRVMVVAPRYGNYNEAQHIGVRKRYKVDGQDHEVNYFHAYIDGVDFVFIDSPMFRHIENSIYGGNRVDILKRMILFCKVAVEVPWHVPCGGICYGDGNLAFVANDWHTALLPVYLKAYYRDNGLMKYTRSVLVIHNIAHQGRGPVDDFSYLDLPLHYLDLFKLYDPLGGEHCNIFAAGLKSADRVVTVSHGYSWELKTHEGGWGLHGIINDHDWKLRGIVNGIDTKEWSPELDVHLQSDGYVNYSVDTLQSGKPQCKAALQKELGLPVRADIPLIGFIGRLDQQKGIDLIANAVPWMMGENVQLVMLGTGRPDLEQLLRHFEGQYYDKVRGWVGFSVKTAHRITAGADILLMPSRFEPCGLNQLYAMRYGTIPVVHAVGGLRDTVHPFNPYEESGFGWTFERAEASELIHALGNCLYTYREYKKSWEGLQKRGMTQDLSWDNAAQTYEEVLVAAKYQW